MRVGGWGRVFETPAPGLYEDRGLEDTTPATRRDFLDRGGVPGAEAAVHVETTARRAGESRMICDCFVGCVYCVCVARWE